MEEVRLLDWRILAAAASVLMVLGSGTLLAGQVRHDLEAGVDARLADERAAREGPALKLNEMRLPSDLPLDIPRGSEISPDQSMLKLLEGVEYNVPNDLDLSGLDLKLPEDFILRLPEGTTFSPPGLELPAGGSIRLPDGRSFDFPPGTKLDLPPELVERLFAAGVTAGPLQRPFELSVEDLPPGLKATLDPPDFEGAGKIRLPAGTTITLPDGRRFPFAPGLLPYAARYLLPAGSTIETPFSIEGEHQGVFPVPRANHPAQLARDDARGPSLVTEITSLPPRIRKGEAFVAGGYVRGPDGRPVAGAPVEIHVNETKDTPGRLVGEGRSDAKGTFAATVRLPDDQPAGNYQLVVHALGFTDASGRTWGDGWGDPPFSTFAGTTLTLELPSADGLGAQTLLAGLLLDHTGAPVTGATLTLSVNDRTIARPVTDVEGRYAVAHVFPSGTHSVQALFAGDAHHEASASPRASISIGDFALDIPPILYAEPGDTLLLSGRVLGKGAAAPDRQVSITGSLVGSGDDVGTSFRFTGASDASGPYLRLDGSRERNPRLLVPPGALVELAVQSNSVERVRVCVGIEPATCSPYADPQGAPATLRFHAPASGSLDYFANVPTARRGTIEVSPGALPLAVTSDATGRFSFAYALPPGQAPGSYTLSYRLADGLAQKTQTVVLNVTARLGVEVRASGDVEEPLPVTITLRDDGPDARPIPGAKIALEFAGPGGTVRHILTTDGTGVATTMLRPLRPIPGDHRLLVEPAGGPHLQAKAVTRHVKLDVFEVTWQTPDVVVRGEGSSGTATVRFGGKPLADTPVTLDLFGPRPLTTDANGRLAWSMKVPADADAGSHDIRLTADGHPSRTTRVEVIAATKLDLSLPDHYELGKPVGAELRLVDDRGEPLRNARVTLSGPGLTTSVTTDREGRWRGPLNVSTTDGNVTLAAEYEAQRPYLGSQSVKTMSIATPSSPLPREAWLYPLVGALAIAAGAGTWYGLKRWRPARAAPVAVAPVPAAPLAPPDIELRFGIPAGEPDVWGVGEPLELTVRNGGAPGEFDLQHDGGSSRLRLDAGAHVSTRLTFSAEGEIVVRARRVGAEGKADATARVRIVDYRKETAREFDLFLEKARAVDPSLTRRSTPREIQWTLGARLGPEAEDHLEELALVLEVTNYSHYEVARPHYLRFVRAARALDTSFAPAPDGG